MSNKISPEERRMIDAAIAAGKVTVCPPQTYSAPHEQPIAYKEMVKNKVANFRRGQKLKALKSDPPEVEADRAAQRERAQIIEAEKNLDIAKRREENLRARKEAERERQSALRAERRAAANAEKNAAKARFLAERDEQIIAIIESGRSQMSAALELGMAPMTVSRCVRRLRDEGRIQK